MSLSDGIQRSASAPVYSASAAAPLGSATLALGAAGEFAYFWNNENGLRILLVGDSAEARRVRRSVEKPVPVRWEDLRAADIDRVVEAAHPCDALTAWAVQDWACRHDVPHLQLVRPPWRAGSKDRWRRVRDARAAVRVIPVGARVFLAMGRAALPALQGLRARVVVRRRGAAPSGLPLLAGARYVSGRGPYRVHQEMQVLRRLGVTWVMVFNAGGTGAWPKLAAARRLGLRVAIVDRPTRPPGKTVTHVEGVWAWLQSAP